MPISTIIGFLLGLTIMGLWITRANGPHKPTHNMSEASTLTRQTFHVFGMIMFMSSFLGLLGTFIEMALS